MPLATTTVSFHFHLFSTIHAWTYVNLNNFLQVRPTTFPVEDLTINGRMLPFHTYGMEWLGKTVAQIGVLNIEPTMTLRSLFVAQKTGVS